MVEIVDGDTIRVQVDGAVYSLRYIGIDSPERGAPHSDEATAANRQLVDGKTVYLERDVSETDRFDRLLRYVWLRDGVVWLLVNRELVRLGVASSKAYPPDTAFQSLFDSAETQAKAAGLGMWAATPAPPPPTAAVTNCDPSYPDVCIPRYPPDLDCGDIPYRRFTVLPPDPHGFDGDHDGIGCESG